jgi:hypothetical protein
MLILLLLFKKLPKKNESPSSSVPESHTVLPGPEQAGPPFQQKYTAIWQKHTANPFFLIPLLFRYLTSFSHINFKNKNKIFL